MEQKGQLEEDESRPKVTKQDKRSADRQLKIIGRTLIFIACFIGFCLWYFPRIELQQTYAAINKDSQKVVISYEVHDWVAGLRQVLFGYRGRIQEFRWEANVNERMPKIELSVGKQSHTITISRNGLRCEKFSNVLILSHNAKGEEKSLLLSVEPNQIPTGTLDVTPTLVQFKRHITPGSTQQTVALKLLSDGCGARLELDRVEIFNSDDQIFSVDQVNPADLTLDIDLIGRRAGYHKGQLVVRYGEQTKTVLMEALIAPRNPIFFDFDEWENPNSVGKAALEAHNLFISQLPESVMVHQVVKGYADYRGGDDYNCNLSRRRAKIVSKSVGSPSGIYTSQLVGYGNRKVVFNIAAVCIDGKISICEHERVASDRRVEIQYLSNQILDVSDPKACSISGEDEGSM